MAVDQFFATFADQSDDECGPARLVRCAEAFSGFCVEIFVKQQEILPVRDVAVACCITEAGAVAIFAR